MQYFGRIKYILLLPLVLACGADSGVKYTPVPGGEAWSDNRPNTTVEYLDCGPDGNVDIGYEFTPSLGSPGKFVAITKSDVVKGNALDYIETECGTMPLTGNYRAVERESEEGRRLQADFDEAKAAYEDQEAQ